MSGKIDVPKVVLEQLEMVRMQGRFNMLDMNGVQVAANDLGFSELVCYIEDLPRRGGWMPTLHTLDNLTDAERDTLRNTLAELDA